MLERSKYGPISRHRDQMTYSDNQSRFHGREKQSFFRNYGGAVIN
jgi:hypothetical protein